MPASYNSRTLAIAIVGALVASQVAFAPFSLTHLDFARDVVSGLAIAAGRELPLQGPVLAGTIHLGPVWNYLLGAVMLVARSWLAACIVVAAIEAAKFVLAYRLGSLLWSRQVGLLWAAGMALPGWSLYALVLPTHPSLVETLVLAFMLFTLRFHRDGTSGSLVAAAIAYALALHAHPTTFPVLLLALPPVVMRLRARTLRWPALALACAAALVWFVPVVYEQIAGGFADLRGGQRYFESAQTLGDPRDALRVIVGGLVTGPRVVASDLLGWSDANGKALAALMLTWIGLGLLGVVMHFRGLPHRGIVAVAAIVAIVTIVAITAIRAITPYYFFFPAWPIVTGLAALGLSAWIGNGRARVLVMPLAVAVLALSLVIEIRAATQIAGGRVRLALLPLFDIKKPFERGMPTPLMPAYAMRTLGERYCAEQAVALHGALAFFALHDYGVEASLACGRRPRITLAGPPRDGDTVLAGVTRPMAARLGVANPAYIGPLAVTSAVRAIHPAAGYELPPAYPYPPLPGTFGPPAALVLDFDVNAGEVVLVSNDYFGLTIPPIVAARVDGRPVDAVSADAISTAFACAACDGVQHWRLSILAPDAQRVDVVVLHP